MRSLTASPPLRSAGGRPCEDVAGGGRLGQLPESVRELGAGEGVAGDDEQGVVAGDGPDDVGQRGRSSALARKCAAPGRGAQHREVAEASAETSSSAEQPGQSVGAAGDAAHRAAVVRDDVAPDAAVGAAQLHRAELVEVARQRGLGDLDALGGQQRRQLGLAAHRVRADQRDDPRLPGGPASSATLTALTARPAALRPSSQASSAFWACSRFSASSQTADARAVDDLGGDLVAAVGGQAVQHDGVGAARGQQRGVDRKARNGPARSRPSPSWPMEVQVSVASTSAPSAAACGSSTTGDRPAGLRRPASAASARTAGSGTKPSGARDATCIPAVTPPSSSEWAMLLAPSPK